MKVWYKNEQDSARVICGVVSVDIAAAWAVQMYAQIRGSSAMSRAPSYTVLAMAAETAAFAFLAYFVLRCGRVASTGTRNRRKWHEHLVRHGIKCEGRVVEAIEERTRSASSDHARYAYYFRVRYYSELTGREEQFVTPALAFKPKKGKSYLCDVYEMTAEEDEREQQENRTGYSFTLNPFRMLDAIEAENRRESFGNVVADGFREVAA